MKIETVQGFSPERIRFLLYGESGVGKTVHASTWPKPLFLDADDGMASVRRQVDRISIRSWEEIFEVFAWLRDQRELVYQTIVVDTLNEIQRLILDFIVAHYPGRRNYDTQPTLPDYGKMIDETINFVRFLRALPINLVIVTQVRDREFETDAVQPLLMGKRTAKDVCRMMDLVGFMFKTEDGKRAIAFDAPAFVTKDRTGMLPAVVTFEQVGDGFNLLSDFLKPNSDNGGK